MHHNGVAHKRAEHAPPATTRGRSAVLSLSVVGLRLLCYVEYHHGETQRSSTSIPHTGRFSRSDSCELDNVLNFTSLFLSLPPFPPNFLLTILWLGRNGYEES